METHYHSQFDNDEYYNADVFRFHHELYGLLVMAFDRVKVAPVNVGRTLQALQESVRPVTGREDEKSIRVLLERTAEAKKIADEVYRKVKEINDVKNADAACCIHKGGQESHIEEKSEADGADEAESATVQRGENAADTEANDRNAALQKQLLYLFRKCQDYFVRLNWHDEVLFPHEAARAICAISATRSEAWRRGMCRGPWTPCTWWTTTSTRSSSMMKCTTTLRNMS